MIKIPLDQTSAYAITVEETEDGGLVSLSIDLELGELVPFSKSPADELGPVLERNEKSPEKRCNFERILYLEVVRLRELVARMKEDERSIDRNLYPHEARALAAALNHYAEEAVRYAAH